MELLQYTELCCSSYNHSALVSRFFFLTYARTPYMSSNIHRIGGLLSHIPSHHGILQVITYKGLSVSVYNTKKQYITRAWALDMKTHSEQAKLCRGIYLGLLFAKGKEECLNIEIIEKDVVDMLTQKIPPSDDLCEYYGTRIQTLANSTQWTGISYSGYKLNWVDF